MLSYGMNERVMAASRAVDDTNSRMLIPIKPVLFRRITSLILRYLFIPGYVTHSDCPRHSSI